MNENAFGPFKCRFDRKIAERCFFITNFYSPNRVRERKTAYLFDKNSKIFRKYP